MLEIGSGTNHFVNQLLCTRSGENVLALLTLVVSFLDNSATEVLSIIFDTFGVSSDHIPGITQLQNVRSACLPLARAMDFKDRVTRTHMAVLT